MDLADHTSFCIYSSTLCVEKGAVLIVDETAKEVKEVGSEDELSDNFMHLDGPANPSEYLPYCAFMRALIVPSANLPWSYFARVALLAFDDPSDCNLFHFETTLMVAWAVQMREADMALGFDAMLIFKPRAQLSNMQQQWAS